MVVLHLRPLRVNGSFLHPLHPAGILLGMLMRNAGFANSPMIERFWQML